LLIFFNNLLSNSCEVQTIEKLKNDGEEKKNIDWPNNVNKNEEAKFGVNMFL
jgi:hypothetical protein